MRLSLIGILLMAGIGAPAQAPGSDSGKLQREMANRIRQIKALKSGQQGPAYLLRHLYEAKPEPGIWFLEIKVDDPPSAAVTPPLPVVHLKGIGKSQTIVTQLLVALEGRKEWFPAVTLRSIKAAAGNGEAGPEGREFELDLTAAASAETKSADEKSDKPETGRVALESEYERCKAFMPLEEQMGALLQSLNREAVESGLRITSLEPQPGFNERGFYQEKTIKMSVAGGYHDIAAYFDKIGLFKRIINIRNLHVMRGVAGAGPGVQALNADFDAVVYLQKPLAIAFAAPKPGPQSDQSTTSLIQGELIYRHLGDPDPFWSSGGCGLLFTLPELKGIKKYKLEEMTLNGLSETNGLKLAMLSAENKPYFVKAGDQCYDATVLAIDAKSHCVKWRQVIPQAENNLRPYKDVTSCLNTQAAR